MARLALKKYDAKILTLHDDDLRDAALQLRMAMEALTYERAMTYADELGPDQMKTWQPKRLMERMLEVDPQADSAATLSFGVEPSYGKSPEKMTLLGTDNVLKLATLKKHYDALGSYLHTPTLSQLEKNKSHDMIKLQKRCEIISEAIKTVLSSKVWGSSMANRGEIECFVCDKPIRRRLLHGVDVRKVECWECQATYNMSRTNKDQVQFEPRQSGIPCIAPECDTVNYLWEKEFGVGLEWDCRDCGMKQKLAYGVSPVDIGQAT